MTARSYQLSKPVADPSPETVGYLYRTDTGYAISWRQAHEVKRTTLFFDSPRLCEVAFEKAVPGPRRISKGAGVS